MPHQKINYNSNAYVHPTAEIDSNVSIGKETKIWYFSHIMENTIIGEQCNIGQNVVVGPDVTIGKSCKIQNNVSVYKGVTLEDEVFCGPSMVFTNVINPRAHIKRMEEIRPTLVRKGATLGANSTIVCGVTIGQYALVGAGAVVTKDVPDFALVTGNPAKQSGWMCECGTKLNPNFDCPACHKHYDFLTKNNDTLMIPFIDIAAQQKRILVKIEKAIKTVLHHGNYIMGPEVMQLERKLSHFTGVENVITCSSGTDALLMVLMSYKVGPGDAVFTTPFSFVATVEVIRLLGATPIFVDIDPVTYNITPDKLQIAISNCRHLNPKVIIPVDLFGLPCDYNKIMKIASKFDLKVIADAAQSFGAEYKKKKACSFADATCTSFFPAKPLGCYGDGGAIFTDDEVLAKKLVSIREHGKGNNKYQNTCIGLNGRLDTLQAAILLTKLEVFPWEFEMRQNAADIYSNLISSSECDLILPFVPNGLKSSWAQYSVLAKDTAHRNELQRNLKQKKIPTAIYYPTPLHLQKAFLELGYQKGDMPISEDYARRIFSLPMHPDLNQKLQKYICSFL